MSIRDRILQKIEERKTIPVPVCENANLYTDLGFHSLSFIGLLLELEEEEQITFAIAEMERCTQLRELLALVEKKQKERDESHD